MKTTILLVVLLAACRGEFPSNTIVESPPDVDKALIVIHDLLEQEMDMELPRMNDSVTWMEGKCLEDVGWNDDGLCLTGIFDSVNGIFLIKRDTIADSALPHEVMHYMIYSIYCKHDHDHTRPKWWSLQDKAKQALQSAGL